MWIHALNILRTWPKAAVEEIDIIVILEDQTTEPQSPQWQVADAHFDEFQGLRRLAFFWNNTEDDPFACFSWNESSQGHVRVQLLDFAQTKKKAFW